MEFDEIFSLFEHSFDGHFFAIAQDYTHKRETSTIAIDVNFG